MSCHLYSLDNADHAFYRVLPYYVLLEERPRYGPPTTRKVQAGFDVEIHGVNTLNEMSVPASGSVHDLGYAELQKVAERVSSRTGGSCFLEVASSPSTPLFDTRDSANVEEIFRIRITHYRGLDQDCYIAEEETALKEIENELYALGVTRR